MKIKFYVVLMFLFSSLSLFAEYSTYKFPNKILISKFQKNSDVSSVLEKTIYQTMKLTILENMTYSVYTYSDIRTIYPKIARSMMNGCNQEKCAIQLIQQLTIPEVIYGNIEITDSNMIYVFLRNESFSNRIFYTNIPTKTNDSVFIKTKKTNIQYYVKSSVEYEFKRDDLSHTISEITKKLLDKHYTLNLQQPKSKTILLPSIQKLPEEKIILNPNKITFNTNDTKLYKLYQNLNSDIKKVDTHFKKKEYVESLKLYNYVLTKFNKKVPDEKKITLISMLNNINDRIFLTKKMLIEEKILSAEKKFDDKKFKDSLDEYNQALIFFHSLDKQTQLKLKQIYTLILKNQDAFSIFEAKKIEQKAEQLYSNLDFKNATLTFSDAIYKLRDLNFKEDYSDFITTLKDKEIHSYKIGYVAFKNKISSYYIKINKTINQDLEKSITALNELKQNIFDSLYSDDFPTIYVYNELARSLQKPTIDFPVKFQKIYGGFKNDEAVDVVETPAHNYIVASWTFSQGHGQRDILLQKFDNRGTLKWEKLIGGPKDDIPYSLSLTKDNKILLCGFSIASNRPFSDMFLTILNTEGDILWTKRFGTAGSSGAQKFLKLNSGYIIAGWAIPSGSPTYSGRIIKLREDKFQDWGKIYGGTKEDEIYDIVPLNNQLLVAGRTMSKGQGSFDMWVFLIDEKGNTLWEKTFGGANWDEALSITKVENQNFLIVGSTKSKGAGDFDFYILKIDSTGKLIWEKTFGGEYDDKAYDAIVDYDGNYVIAGWTGSFTEDSYDAWIIKIDQNGKKIWTKTFGGEDEEKIFSIKRTYDKGYIITGHTDSFGQGKYDSYILNFKRLPKND